MFENLFGNVQKQQEELAQKLSQIMVEAEAGGGAVRVVATADNRIKSLALDASKLDLTNLEQLEDFLLVALNEALEKAQAKAGEETQNLIKNMMPFGGLDNFIGK